VHPFPRRLSPDVPNRKGGTALPVAACFWAGTLNVSDAIACHIVPFI